MKRFLPALALLLASVQLTISAQESEWLHITSTDEDGIIDFYINKEMPTLTGNGYRMWALADIVHKPKSRSNLEGLSWKDYYEVDCKENKLKVLSSITYSKPMGKGEVLHIQSKPSDWMFIAPNTILEELTKRPCRILLPTTNN